VKLKRKGNSHRETCLHLNHAKGTTQVKMSERSASIFQQTASRSYTGENVATHEKFSHSSRMKHDTCVPLTMSKWWEDRVATKMMRDLLLQWRTSDNLDSNC